MLEDDRVTNSLIDVGHASSVNLSQTGAHDRVLLREHDTVLVWIKSSCLTRFTGPPFFYRHPKESPAWPFGS